MTDDITHVGSECGIATTSVPQDLFCEEMTTFHGAGPLPVVDTGVDDRDSGQEHSPSSIRFNESHPVVSGTLHDVCFKTLAPIPTLSSAPAQFGMLTQSSTRRRSSLIMERHCIRQSTPLRRVYDSQAARSTYTSAVMTDASGCCCRQLVSRDDWCPTCGAVDRGALCSISAPYTACFTEQPYSNVVSLRCLSSPSTRCCPSNAAKQPTLIPSPLQCSPMYSRAPPSTVKTASPSRTTAGTSSPLMRRRTLSHDGRCVRSHHVHLPISTIEPSKPPQCANVTATTPNPAASLGGHAGESEMPQSNALSATDASCPVPSRPPLPPKSASSTVRAPVQPIAATCSLSPPPPQETFPDAWTSLHITLQSVDNLDEVALSGHLEAYACACTLQKDITLATPYVEREPGSNRLVWQTQMTLPYAKEPYLWFELLRKPNGSFQAPPERVALAKLSLLRLLAQQESEASFAGDVKLRLPPAYEGGSFIEKNIRITTTLRFGKDAVATGIAHQLCEEEASPNDTALLKVSLHTGRLTALTDVERPNTSPDEQMLAYCKVTLGKSTGFKTTAVPVGRTAVVAWNTTLTFPFTRDDRTLKDEVQGTSRLEGTCKLDINALLVTGKRVFRGMLPLFGSHKESVGTLDITVDCGQSTMMRPPEEHVPSATALQNHEVSCSPSSLGDQPVRRKGEKTSGAPRCILQDVWRKKAEAFDALLQHLQMAVMTPQWKDEEALISLLKGVEQRLLFDSSTASFPSAKPSTAQASTKAGDVMSWDQLFNHLQQLLHKETHTFQTSLQNVGATESMVHKENAEGRETACMDHLFHELLTYETCRDKLIKELLIYSDLRHCFPDTCTLADSEASLRIIRAKTQKLSLIFDLLRVSRTPLQDGHEGNTSKKESETQYSLSSTHPKNVNDVDKGTSDDQPYDDEIGVSQTSARCYVKKSGAILGHVCSDGKNEFTLKNEQNDASETGDTGTDCKRVLTELLHLWSCQPEFLRVPSARFNVLQSYVAERYVDVRPVTDLFGQTMSQTTPPACVTQSPYTPLNGAHDHAPEIVYDQKHHVRDPLLQQPKTIGVSSSVSVDLNPGSQNDRDQLSARKEHTARRRRQSVPALRTVDSLNIQNYGLVLRKPTADEALTKNGVDGFYDMTNSSKTLEAYGCLLFLQERSAFLRVVQQLLRRMQPDGKIRRSESLDFHALKLLSKGRSLRVALTKEAFQRCHVLQNIVPWSETIDADEDGPFLQLQSSQLELMANVSKKSRRPRHSLKKDPPHVEVFKECSAPDVKKPHTPSRQFVAVNVKHVDLRPREWSSCVQTRTRLPKPKPCNDKASTLLDGLEDQKEHLHASKKEVLKNVTHVDTREDKDRFMMLDDFVQRRVSSYLTPTPQASEVDQVTSCSLRPHSGSDHNKESQSRVLSSDTLPSHLIDVCDTKCSTCETTTTTENYPRSGADPTSPDTAASRVPGSSGNGDAAYSCAKPQTSSINQSTLDASLEKDACEERQITITLTDIAPDVTPYNERPRILISGASAEMDPQEFTPVICTNSKDRLAPPSLPVPPSLSAADETKYGPGIAVFIPTTFESALAAAKHQHRTAMIKPDAWVSEADRNLILASALEDVALVVEVTSPPVKRSSVSQQPWKQPLDGPPMNMAAPATLTLDQTANLCKASESLSTVNKESDHTSNARTVLAHTSVEAPCAIMESRAVFEAKSDATAPGKQDITLPIALVSKQMQDSNKPQRPDVLDDGKGLRRDDSESQAHGRLPIIVSGPNVLDGLKNITANKADSTTARDSAYIGTEAQLGTQPRDAAGRTSDNVADRTSQQADEKTTAQESTPTSDYGESTRSGKNTRTFVLSKLFSAFSARSETEVSQH